jgi:FlaG/FlaF family flagellin (archaellin)
MDRVIIAWNFRNWITVILMVAIGMALVGLVSSFIQSHLLSQSNTPISANVSVGS